MTDREQDHLDGRLDRIEEAIETGLKETSKQIEVIRRGVYGDKENKVEGLIELVPKVKALEDFRKKLAWGIAGAIVVIEAVHWLSQHNFV